MPHVNLKSVLIAGAGPVGLSLAIELGMRGIECTLVERTDGKLSVPRMTSVSARSMELCRRWGVADKVRQAAWPETYPHDFIYLTTMVGEELARLKIGSYLEQRNKLSYSPEGRALCPQIYLDPILAEKAASLPSVTIRYRTVLDSFEQDDTGVQAYMTDTASGRTEEITADYLVGCDGAGSGIRRQLGIPLEGQGTISTSVNVFFRSSSLAQIHDKGWAYIHRFLDENGCWGELVGIDGKELWRLSVFHVQNPDLSGKSYLRKLAGRDFGFEILDVSQWDRRDFLARHYRKGRTLIAGDAAHQMSPTGGAGMHTGMCEAHNLAWKLAAELKGWAGPKLLDSYEAECRPAARRNVEFSTSRYNALASLPGAKAFKNLVSIDPGLPKKFSPPPQFLAEIYYANSPICIYDDPSIARSAETGSSAMTGTRAPHCWLTDGLSTLDLFGEGFVLLRLGGREVDVEQLSEAAARKDVPLEIVDIDNAQATTLFGKQLVLVRPDCHVAWLGDLLPEDCVSMIDKVRGA